MDGSPGQFDPSTTQESVDPHRAPGGVAAPELEDAIDEVPMGAVRAVVGTPGLVSEPLDAFLSVVSAPTAQGALRDPKDPAEIRGPGTPLKVLTDDL
jgi:hypothetical protein